MRWFLSLKKIILDGRFLIIDLLAFGKPMKYPQLLLVGLFGLLVSCVKDRSDPYEPDLPFKPAKTGENTQHPGYGPYMKACHQCHQQADPLTLSEDKWTMTVPAMAKHAGVTEKEGEQILDFILSLKSEGMR